MQFWASFYSLEAQIPLSYAWPYSSRKGALLKFAFKDGMIGYADFHRPQDFQDTTTSEESLSIIKNSMDSQQFLDAVDFAKQTAEESETPRPLLKASQKIKSHYLVCDLKSFSKEDFESVLNRGFNRIKIKMGQNLEEETESLKKLLSFPFKESFKLRLDFNLSMDYKSFTSWLDDNYDWLALRTEFIEDPFIYNEEQWEEIQNEYLISLALDRAGDYKLISSKGYSFLTLKPAIDEMKVFLKSPLAQNFSKKRDVDCNDPLKGLVITHYMDHPLGQLAALRWASELQLNLFNVSQCGLHQGEYYKYDKALLGEYKYSESSHGNSNLTPQILFKDTFESLSWLACS